MEALDENEKADTPPWKMSFLFCFFFAAAYNMAALWTTKKRHYLLRRVLPFPVSVRVS